MFTKISVFFLLSFCCLSAFSKADNFGCPDSDKECINSASQLKKTSDEGDIESTYWLGNHYMNAEMADEGVPLLTKASEKGHAWAANDLGFAYSKGHGVKKDKEKALYYYELAAKRGDRYGIYNAGEAYLLGNTSSQDFAKAKDYLTQLKLEDKEGYGCASHLLGIMYTQGLGVSVDRKLAEDYFTKAIRSQVLNFLRSMDVAKKPGYGSEFLFTHYAPTYSSEMLKKYSSTKESAVNLSNFTRDYNSYLKKKCLGDTNQLLVKSAH